MANPTDTPKTPEMVERIAMARLAVDIARLRSLYLAGTSAFDIQRITGIDRKRVARLLTASGVPLRNGSGKFTPDEEQQISDRYAVGEHPKHVAADYGIAARTVQDIARRHGVRVRGIWETRGKLPLRDDVFSTVTPESAYWVGFLMADGWVKPAINEVGLSLATPDAAHVAAFRDFLGYGGKITIKPPRKSPTSSNMTTGAQMVSVRSATMCADLIRYGVVANKSFAAKVSGELTFNRDFWRGVIDGDGSLGWHVVEQRRYPYVSLCGARPLLIQFADFIRSLGIVTTATVRPDKTIWQFRLTGSPAFQLVKHLYRDRYATSLTRKRCIADDILAATHHNT